MSLTATNQTSITHTLTADVNGQPKAAATLTGQVVPAKAMTLSLIISDEHLAAEYHSDLSAALDAFMAELRQLAGGHGLPV